MRYIKSKLIFTVFTVLVLFSTCIAQSQTKPLPVQVTCRKSLLGGSYVLQIRNTSPLPIEIWLEAREKYATFIIQAEKMKEIGWVQGFRFDANDVFFIGSNGYDIIRQTMPSNELSEVRVDFLNNGALTVNLSQTFLQKKIAKSLKLPINKKYQGIIEIEMSKVPEIILKDRSDRIHANVLLQTITFSGNVKIPIKASISFLPSYISSTGEILASQINVDDININGLQNKLSSEATNIINGLLPIWFSEIRIFQLDTTTLKYLKFLNVRQISVYNRRLAIELL
ncbi:MAG: hypothetical protein A2499_16130 [Stygiobacter sp. RIFOXYC12_FULL_38_8]|nr:MAG: hypothetical protein A2X62_08140 [Stygiobacter sp. GWC2_38_9]OGV07058.1 MAG: hypothetical protein A2299_03750 [Stygiobacter sp. RIFOXYB2_FULL_37_11]OGV10432.1 MAG: hypothetical protein A2237_03875 [Stygiobacter sp. RIFOXYA2_FULL_38_8]OGV12425.1 MAG: hypothetical protein A2440_14305 [Stygiobacter sp. RIFOXYC2_FULL_38_25]OGV24055.1 MAG: hypothetical protein A2499_16130 [Stygiobacter sp. RIFOXYC12_FULL_38_8]OGV83023.1 MAG: hypothetical protein A2X65_11070 [Stygiobacter sp. GWF2_38_21]